MQGMILAVVKVRRSAPDCCSATFNFSRAVLWHVYVCRGELRERGERSKGAHTQQIMSKKGHEKTTMTKKGHQNFQEKMTE